MSILKLKIQDFREVDLPRDEWMFLGYDTSGGTVPTGILAEMDMNGNITYIEAGTTTVTNGTSGKSGTSGQNGSSGTSGLSGTNGVSVTGDAGTPGTSGSSGADGSFLGTSGSSGKTGSSGVSSNGSSGSSGIGLSGSSGTSGSRGSSGTSGISQAKDRWTLIDPTKYTTTPTSLNSIQFIDTSFLDIVGSTNPSLYIGTPLKYFMDDGSNVNSISKYGIISGITTDTVYIAGAPLTDGDTDLIQNLYYGAPELVSSEIFGISGSYAQSGGTDQLLYNYDLIKYEWQKYSALLVRFQASHKNNSDNITNQPYINVSINSNKVSTSNSGDGIEVSGITSTTVVDIDISKYNIRMGNLLEISTTPDNYKTYPATDLTVSMTFINDKPEIIPY